MAMPDNDERDWRPFVISELDQMIAAISDGEQEAYDDARDWLADLVMDGDRDVIATMLRGFQNEMSAGLDEDRGSD